ncbi:MAG: HEPN domain-containing protein [Thermoproteus sp. AZ2]|jgi:HEPN domain-containing protein|uniref:HEPN domain-containing protein n=1 Tax=Thermoproteus sp. AZ2 TaxID=1609232 RepID=A0ACC6UYQ2_9CREN|nr:MAG: DNA-binding protein [Thermoproteus sp. AZ2]
MSFLLENARSFLRAARRDLGEGEYNLALFHAEQALQLCAKYRLYLAYGDYPKTHRLKELLDALGHHYDPLVVDLLEEAYIGARYLPMRYSEASAERALGEVERLMREMGCLS